MDEAFVIACQGDNVHIGMIRDQLVRSRCEMMIRDMMCVATIFTFTWVHVNRHIGQRGHLVEKVMPNLFSNAMTIASRHLTIHRDMQLGALTMTHPADGNIVDLHNIFYL